ncbi:hypothetical protein EDC01DRAFT_22741 [Geopyxis carbonaria]|nr:hypothetical protein EDC01DRAFT_22741 [Geopyxis carbonaria]
MSAEALPAYPPPNYVNPETRVPEFLGVQIGMTALALVIVSARLWTRARLVRAIGLDDYLIAVAMALGTVQTILTCMGLRGGTGLHIWDVPPTSDVSSALKYSFATQVLYMPIVQLVKISILTFYLRLTPLRPFRLAVFTVMGVCIAFGFAVTMTDLFQCSPIRKGWFSTLPGKCIDQVLFFRSTAIINIILDFTLFLLPLPVMWSLQMRLRQRLALCGVFSVGLFVCVASIVRLTTFYGAKAAKTNYDPTYYGVDAQDWSCIEYCTGLICASLPHLKPLMARVLPRIFGSTKAASSGYGGTGGMYGGRSRAQGGAYALNSVDPATGRPGGGVTTTGVRGGVRDRDNESEEYIFKDGGHGGMGITVVQDFSVEHGGREDAGSARNEAMV